MKNNLLLLSILLNSFILFAGDTYKVIYGEAYDIPKKHFLMESIMTDEGNIIELYKGAADITINKFDKSLKQVKSNIVDIKTLPKELFSIGIIDVKNRHFWIYNSYDKKLNKESLYALEINYNGLKFINDPIVLLTTEKKIFNNYVYDKFNISYSNDSSKILFYSLRYYPDSRIDNVNIEKRALAVYDLDMKKIFSRSITLPKVEAQMKVLTFKVDNNGEVYIVCQVSEVGENINYLDNQTENLQYEIIKYNADLQANPISKSIKLKNKMMNSFNIIEKENNQVIFTGEFSDIKKANEKNIDVNKGLYFIEFNNTEINNVNNKGFYYYRDDQAIINSYIIKDQLKRSYYIASYGSKIKYTGVEGLIIFRIDNLNINDINLENYMHEITTEITKSYPSDRETKQITVDRFNKINIGEASLRFSEIYSYNDSSISVIGEEYWLKEYTYCDLKGICSSYYTNNYGNIIISHFDKNLKSTSFTKIPKLTESNKTPGQLSYKLIFNDEKLFLFYLDNLENLKLNEFETPTQYRNNGILICATVDKSGYKKRYQVLDQSKIEYPDFKITDFKWSNETKILFGHCSGGPKDSPKYKNISIGIN